MNYAEIKVGEWVLYSDGRYTPFAYEVKRLTKTRIVVKNFGGDDDKVFNRENGSAVPRPSYDYSKITRYATDAEIAHAKEVNSRLVAEKAERKRLEALTARVSEKLAVLTGVGIRVVCWSRKDDGTRTFKIEEAENLTEADLQRIIGNRLNTQIDDSKGEK